MGLLDGFEKLINEHGSAVILKERIELANDKYAALEQKANNLEAENKTLRHNLDQANAEIENLKKLTDNTDGNHIEDIREKILLAVAHNQEITDQQIAQIVGVSQLICTFHLEELKTSRMVSVKYIMGSDWAGTSGSVVWSIAQPGLSYLVSHALIA